MKKFRGLSGDILKIAGRAKDANETGKFLGLCAALKKLPRVFIAMGPEGTATRIAGFTFGSGLTYGFIHKAVAPGQVPVQDLRRIFDALYPAR